MNHPDPDVLVTFALGEPTHPSVLDHVPQCDVCGAEVGRLHDVMAAATGLGGGRIVLERPPDQVWTAILAQTREHSRAPAPTTEVPRRRRHRVTGSAVGFALGVAATVALTVVIHQNDTAPRPAPEAGRTIADGVVRPFGDGSTTSGTLSVVQDHRQRSIRIRLNRMSSSSSDFVQAWLLDPQNNDMIALGVMGGRTETFPLPTGVNLSAYNSVDLSLEPFDGDPQHSAISLARGSISPASPRPARHTGPIGGP